MPRFFCDRFEGDKALITGEDAKHLTRVLRMSIGDPVTLSDQKGTDFSCQIASIEEDLVILEIKGQHRCETEPTICTILFQALPKGDKMETIVQKSCEMGVTHIYPMLTKRCVSRPDARSMQKKVERYQKVAYAAAKQCGRGIIPTVHPLVSYEEALALAGATQCPMLFYENATTTFRSLLQQPVESYALLIGAEGGFESSEVDKARSLGIPSLSLGKRILRAETAPITALSVLMYETGNL